MADTITLNWTYSGSHTSVLPVLVEKGLTRPEQYRYIPAIKNQYIDGSSENQYKAWIRKATWRTDVLTKQQLIDYQAWGLDNDRTIDYSIDGVTETGIILNPDPEQEIQRYDDFVGSPYIEVSMEEGIARTVWPS